MKWILRHLDLGLDPASRTVQKSVLFFKLCSVVLCYYSPSKLTQLLETLNQFSDPFFAREWGPYGRCFAF